MPASPSHMSSSTSRRSAFHSIYDRKQALRNVLTKTQVLDEHANPDVLRTLESVFKEADEIHDDISLNEKIVNQDEVVLDSEVMSVSSKVIKSCGLTLTKVCSEFNAYDFAEKLLRFVEHLPDTTLAEPNWAILEREIPPFQSIANFVSLLNNLSRTKRKSKRQLNMEKMLAQRSQGSQNTQRTKLDHSIARKKPENVVELEKEEKGVEQTVAQINKLIKNTYRAEGKPINYYRLVLDPGSFGKTIENMLHVSFLCRDGKIKTTTDDDLNLVVIPCSKEMKKNAEHRESTEQFQNIGHLDIETWQFLKDCFRLSESMISNDF